MNANVYRDAAVAAARIPRAAHQDTIDAGGIGGVSQRMAADVASSTAIGSAEIYDLGGTPSRAGTEVMRALSAGLATFLLSVSRADIAAAASLLPGALDTIRHETILRFGRPIDATVAVNPSEEPQS